MSARSSATARLMETWAHGQDILDALGKTRKPTDRLRHVAHLGVSTFGWSYVNRQMDVPDTTVRVGSGTGARYNPVELFDPAVVTPSDRRD